MADSSGFFNSQISNGSQDRVYYSKDFAELFSRFIGNGVYAQPADQLKILPNPSPSMSIQIKPGFGFINGYWYLNTENKSMTIQLNTSNVSKFVPIVLKLDLSKRVISIEVKSPQEGKPGLSNLQRDNVVHELLLGFVSVKQGQSVISEADIYDTRLDTNVCGFIVNPIEHLDTSEIYSQFEAQSLDKINEFDRNSKAQLKMLEDAIKQITEGEGTMLKVSYDQNNNGIVDNSERLEGKTISQLKQQLDEELYPMGKDWKNLSINQDFKPYSNDASNIPKFRVFGNIVTIQGAVQPKQSFQSNLKTHLIASGIDPKFCPSKSLDFICPGSNSSKFVLTIYPNGDLKISKYGASSFEVVPEYAWLPTNVTYAI